VDINLKKYFFRGKDVLNIILISFDIIKERNQMVIELSSSLK